MKKKKKKKKNDDSDDNNNDLSLKINGKEKELEDRIRR